MAELRRDPVIGRWVIISSGQGLRPADFTRSPAPPGEQKVFCPFDEGSERKTPPEVFAHRPKGGEPNSPGWTVRVVPNRYPALRVEGVLRKRGKGMYDVMDGVGAHEVIIESPAHKRSLTQLTNDQVALALLAARGRLGDLKGDKRFEYGMLFKNVGPEAGATIDHVHSQLIVTPIVPRTVRDEMRGGADYHHFRGRCVFCDMVQQEEADGERLVVADDNHIAFCPFASRFPLEMWLLPREHATHFEEASDTQVHSLATVLRSALSRLEALAGNVSYNYIVHSTPFREGHIEHYHWHVEIIPRLTPMAGFEWGTGFYMNPLLPEDAAHYLRQAGSKGQIR